MKKRQWIAAALGALTRQDWVTIAICVAILVLFVATIVGLYKGVAHNYK